MREKAIYFCLINSFICWFLFLIICLSDVTNWKLDSNNLKVTARLGAKQNLFKSFKSDPQVGIYFSKIGRKEENIKLNILFENQQVVEANLDEIKVMPFDNYLKNLILAL